MLSIERESAIAFGVEYERHRGLAPVADLGSFGQRNACCFGMKSE